MIVIAIITKPFCAEDGLHTPASVSVVVKPPFYTRCPGFPFYFLYIFLYILHTVSCVLLSVIILILINHIVTSIVTLHVVKLCFHPCRGRSLHTGDAAIRKRNSINQCHKHPVLFTHFTYIIGVLQSNKVSMS